MTQFLRDQASDSEEVVTPLMLDGTYLSRNFATLGPLPDSRRVLPLEREFKREREDYAMTVDYQRNLLLIRNRMPGPNKDRITNERKTRH